MLRQTIGAGAIALLTISPAVAEPLTSKTVNLDGPLTAAPGELDFSFTHRFSLAGFKVVNSPTFELTTGLAPWTEVGLRYATNSRTAIATDPHNVLHQAIGTINEFEPLVKQRLLAQASGAPLDLTGTMTYNTAANSGDIGIVAARRLGLVTLLAMGRGFTNGFGAAGYTAALGGGVNWQLTKFLNLSADLGTIVYAQHADTNPQVLATSNTPAVSLAAEFAIPYSPHTMLLYVTNADTITLEGSSRGAPPSDPSAPAWNQVLDKLQLGFEFKIPFSSFGRWTSIFTTPPEPPSERQVPQTQATMPPAAAASAPSVPARPGVVAALQRAVTIAGFQFSPPTIVVPVGTVVRWDNKDAVAHSVTSDTKVWDSGLIDPGKTFEHRFDRPGRFPYHCTPHPFMHGAIVVQ